MPCKENNMNKFAVATLLCLLPTSVLAQSQYIEQDSIFGDNYAVQNIQSAPRRVVKHVKQVKKVINKTENNYNTTIVNPPAPPAPVNVTVINQQVAPPPPPPPVTTTTVTTTTTTTVGGQVVQQIPPPYPDPCITEVHRVDPNGNPTLPFVVRSAACY